ncbi:nicotianamine synthase-like [Asparagus officinalis]|uniref:nicotianamine synthase-like n=1 Tax=Asparagus officinalis TaxID=4686 RepID=UPI00098DF24B|nr:nicotianamine synthase-like [Asparagus officinalis]
MATQQELQLVETITSLYESISKLPSLSPSDHVNQLFTKLVTTCIPPSSINIAALSDEAQAMRLELIKLCGNAEGLLESHHSALISNHDSPLNHLYSNYEQLTKLEFTLLSRHVTTSPSKIAFVGSGPLPLSTLVLATRYLTDAVFHNYDLDPSATAKARKLVESDPDLAERVVFRTADVMEVKRALREYDVVFLAALVGMEIEDKRRVLEHLALHMKPNALLVVRSAHGARTFLYPVVETDQDLTGFDVLSVYHPEDEVVNSVIVARKKGINVVPCKCCEPLVGQLEYPGSLVGDQLAIDGQRY